MEKLIFQAEDFKKNFPDNLWPSLNQSRAARKILAALCNAKLEAWLKAAPTVFKLADAHNYWTENSAPRNKGENPNTHKAKLVAIEEIK